MNKRIFLASPHMGGLEQQFVREAFDSNWIAPLGPNVDAFEKEVADYVGAKASTATSSGTSAIHLALKALDVGPGDVVFCSSFTFAASANPILYQGATPVFIDSDYETWNMNPKALKKAFKSEIQKGILPKAVIVVHLYGQSADMDEIYKICDCYDVPIIEDAAESLGATYKGKQTGTIGDLGIFSFNGNKIITTSGGGMLVSNDYDKIKKAKFWATQSREPVRHYQHKEIGYNYRMSNVLAGIGRGQIRVINERIAQKKHIFNTYKEAFSEFPYKIEMMPIKDYGEPNYWLSAAIFTNEAHSRQVIEELEKENIESRPLWKPLHIQPVFEQYPFYSEWSSGSISEDLFNRGICLPSDTKMTDEDLQRVIEVVKRAIR